MEDEMSEEGGPLLREAILRAVDNQINANEPPETRLTLERLLEEGHSEDEARRLIAVVVVAEMFAVMKEGREYDEERFVAALHALPELPLDE